MNSLNFYDRVSTSQDKRDGRLEFDSVLHRRLLKKLEFQADIRAGRAGLCQCMEDYLNGRQHWTHLSGASPVGCSLLLLICARDLPEGLKSYLNMFVEDTKIMRKKKRSRL